MAKYEKLYDRIVVTTLISLEEVSGFFGVYEDPELFCPRWGPGLDKLVTAKGKC